VVENLPAVETLVPGLGSGAGELSGAMAPDGGWEVCGREFSGTSDLKPVCGKGHRLSFLLYRLWPSSP